LRENGTNLVLSVKVYFSFSIAWKRKYEENKIKRKREQSESVFRFHSSTTTQR